MTFADPEFADWLNERFVLAWIDLAPLCAGGEAEAQLRHPPEEIAAYPEGGGGENIRAWFCAPDGDIRHALTGFWRPAAFRLEAERALERYLKAKEALFAKAERGSVRRRMLEEADALERAHPEEKAKPVLESEILRKAAALRRMGELYRKTEPQVGKTVAGVLDEAIRQNPREIG